MAAHSGADDRLLVERDTHFVKDKQHNQLIEYVLFGLVQIFSSDTVRRKFPTSRAFDNTIKNYYSMFLYEVRFLAVKTSCTH